MNINVIKDIITGIISIVLGAAVLYCTSYSEHITVFILGGLTFVVGVLYGGACMVNAAMNWDRMYHGTQHHTMEDMDEHTWDNWTHHGMS